MSPDKQVIGARLRRLREEPPYWSREEMARRLRAAADPRDLPDMPHVKNLAHMIKEWERGKVGVSDPYRSRYARALRRDEADLFAPQAETEPPVALVEPLAINGRPVDVGYVESLRETSQALVKLDTLHGGNDIFPLALRVFREASQKLGAGAYVTPVERDLMAATGEIGEVAAWLAYDADRQDASRQIIMEAMLLSRQAGDRDMELFELAHLAMQSLYLRRPAEALRIVTGVLETGDAGPRVAALYEIRHGRALAQLGDERRGFAALDKAAAALGQSITPRDPYWTWWVDDVELTRHRATAHTQLGRWDRAVPLHEHVVAQGHPGYLDRSQLLDALVQVRDWRRAEDVLPELVDAPIGSARTTNLLRRIAERIGRAKGVPSTIADAAAALR